MNKLAAKISVDKNKIVVSCPRHGEVLASSTQDLLKDRCILVEPGEKECRRSGCKDIMYTWPEIDCQIFDPKE